MFETRLTKKASEPPTDPNVTELTEEESQTSVGEKSLVKASSKSARIKAEKRTLELSEAEIDAILATRAGRLEELVVISDTIVEDKRAVLGFESSPITTSPTITSWIILIEPSYIKIGVSLP
jgi:hypothetical protein